MAKTPLEVARNLFPTTVQLRGKVSYSHISRLVDGEELRRDNEKRRASNRIQMTRPYSALTIANPVIVNEAAVPAILVQLITERISTRVNEDGTSTAVWYGTSKSPSLPDVVYGAEAGTELAGKAIADRTHSLEHELANGLDVTIGVKFFNGSMRSGMGMDYVLVNEPIRYYTGNSVAQALAAQGVVYTPIADGTPAAAAAPVSPVAQPVVQPQPVQPMQAPAGYPAGGQIQQAADRAAANSAAQAAQAAQNPMVGGYQNGGYQPQAPAGTPPLQYNPN